MGFISLGIFIQRGEPIKITVEPNKITRYEKQEGGTVILKNQTEIPVSHRKREQFLERFMAL